MLDHHIQRSIVYRLALLESARFSGLKPDEVENKLFTYHLKKVVAAGLVAKTDKGLYQLTSKGRRLGVHVFEGQLDRLDRAVSVLLLIVRRTSDGAWLLYRRKTHPLRGRVGYMHAAPTSTESTVITARRELKAKTGLEADFAVIGSGYFRVFEGDNLESFTHFNLLASEDATGELKVADKHADYFWELKPDFADPTMLPNMSILAAAYQRGEPFFLEETLQA